MLRKIYSYECSLSETIAVSTTNKWS
jgi:hypothetical protein